MKKLLAVMCCCVMALLLPIAAAADELGDPAANTPKEEVVYGVLHDDGSVDQVYVVNRFALERAGQIRDYGVYQAVNNLTSLAQPQLGDGLVCFEAEAGLFYYQGDLGAAALPWNIAVSYTLDNEPLSGSELAHRSGQLSVLIDISKNDSCDPVFFENYALQITVTLPGDKATNISAENGTIASVGQDKTVSYIIFAEKQGSVGFSAQVSDFTMSGVQIAGIPLSFNTDDFDSGALTEDLSDLSDAVRRLNDGAFDLHDGVVELQDGVAELQDGVGELRDGAGELNDGGAELGDATTELADGLQKLADGSAELADGLSGEDYGGMNKYKNALSEATAAFLAAYAGACAELSQQAAAAGELFSQMYGGAVEVLLYSLNSELGYADYAVAVTGQGLPLCSEGVYTAVSAAYSEYVHAQAKLAEAAGYKGANAALYAVREAYAELDDAINELNDNFSDYADGVSELTDGIGELADGVHELADQLPELTDGVAKLEEGAAELAEGTQKMRNETRDMDDEADQRIRDILAEYGGREFELHSFVSAQNTNINAVQFVLLTAEIGAEESTVSGADEQPQLTKWQTIVENFRRLGRYVEPMREWFSSLWQRVVG